MELKKRMDSLEEMVRILKDAVEEKRTLIALVDNGDGSYEHLQLGRDAEAFSMAVHFITQKAEDDPAILITLLETLAD